MVAWIVYPELLTTKQSKYHYILASGYGGQFLWVVPDLNLVVVALHHIPIEQTEGRVVWGDEIEKVILPIFIPD